MGASARQRSRRETQASRSRCGRRESQAVLGVVDVGRQFRGKSRSTREMTDANGTQRRQLATQRPTRGHFWQSPGSGGVGQHGLSTAIPIKEVDCIATTGATGASPFAASAGKVGRNDPCACRSGSKYKKCCGLNRVSQQGPSPGGYTWRSTRSPSPCSASTARRYTDRITRCAAIGQKDCGPRGSCRAWARGAVGRCQRSRQRAPAAGANARDHAVP